MLDRRLQYVVAIGRLGTFSRAAESIGVTQSAVTKAVADLERSLGYPLFHRTSRGATATEQGRDFLDRAARLLVDASELLGDADRNASPYRGPLRVGVFPGSMEWMFTNPLVAIIKRHPELRVEIQTGNSERGIRLLSRGDIDVALGLHAAFRGWSQFKFEALWTQRVVPFVRQGHPILAAGATDESALVEFDFVVPSSSEPYTAIIHAMFERHGRRPSDCLHMTDHFPLMRRIVASTDAIGLVAVEFTHSHQFSEAFVPLIDLDMLEPLTLGSATRTGWYVKPAVRALIAEIRRAHPSEVPAAD